MLLLVDSALTDVTVPGWVAMLAISINAFGMFAVVLLSLALVSARKRAANQESIRLATEKELNVEMTTVDELKRELSALKRNRDHSFDRRDGGPEAA